MSIYKIEILSCIVLIYGFCICFAAQHTFTYPSSVNDQAYNNNKCPQPTEELMKCINSWICRHPISLDLRCLINLNGKPLLGNLLDNGLSLGSNLLGGLL